MKTIKTLFLTALTVVAFSMMWSCGEEESIDEPQRPNTEKPDNGGNNGGSNGGDNGGNNGGQNKPDPVVTFTNAAIHNITYNSATLTVEYTMANVEESPENKIICRLATYEEELDQSTWSETPLDKSGKFETVFNLWRPSQTYYVRLDVVVCGMVFKSNVVSFKSLEKPYIPVEGITLSETSITLKVGEIKELEAFVQPKDADNKRASWGLYAYQPCPAEWTTIVNTIEAGRDVHYIKGVTPGTAKVVVEIEDNGQKFSAECEVTVVE